MTINDTARDKCDHLHSRTLCEEEKCGEVSTQVLCEEEKNVLSTCLNCLLCEKDKCGKISTRLLCGNVIISVKKRFGPITLRLTILLPY